MVMRNDLEIIIVKLRVIMVNHMYLVRSASYTLVKFVDVQSWLMLLSFFI